MVCHGLLNEHDWRERLYDHIHSRTAGRLRELKITRGAATVYVSARARSFHVRQLAECAVLELLPADSARMAIHVIDESAAAAAHLVDGMRG